jgi:PhnB protein
LTFYGEVFGSPVQLHTFADFDRTDGPADAIAHGYLREGPVALFAADVAGDDPPVRCEGMMLALLGTAAPDTLNTGSPASLRVDESWRSCRRGRGEPLTGT